MIAAMLGLALVGVLPDAAGAGGATDELRPAIDQVFQTSSYEELVRCLRARVATLNEAPVAGIKPAPPRG